MKNLKVTSITLEQDLIVYISYLWTLSCAWTTNPLPPVLGFKHYAEHSRKRAQIGQICYIGYRGRNIDQDEIIISDGIAKELGVTVGDKINIKLRLFGKSDADYLKLYEKKPKKFIKYFNQQSLDDKKKILKELLEYDTTNEEVVKWLDKNYSGLIKEVGLE